MPVRETGLFCRFEEHFFRESASFFAPFPLDFLDFFGRYGELGRDGVENLPEIGDFLGDFHGIFASYRTVDLRGLFEDLREQGGKVLAAAFYGAEIGGFAVLPDDFRDAVPHEFVVDGFRHVGQKLAETLGSGAVACR